MKHKTDRINFDNLQPSLNELDLSYEESSENERAHNENDLDDREHIAILSTN